MTYFQLKEYSNKPDVDEYTLPHYYRQAKRKKQADESNFEGMWRVKRVKVQREFVDKVKEYFLEDEQFYICTPPSSVDFFVNDIKSAVQKTFRYAIDLSSCISKESGVSLGMADYNNYPLENLKKLFKVDPGLKVLLDSSSSSKVLLIDDVYVSGRTNSVMKNIIREAAERDIEFYSGVILKII